MSESEIGMPFTLTLLGTDTNYSPSHVDNAYDKAETLSYVSTLIHGVALPTDTVTEYRNTNVAVVDGPTTLGQEVGDRIARGVQAILEAISRGEEHISIIAHSRGAVEAILVAHELERIQTLMSKHDYDRSQLTNSVCKYTKAAMSGPHSSALAGINLDEVAKHIDKVKLSILNIDPVPGGNYMGITHASTLAWRDPRFYTVPKIVKDYEQYTYENERTRCFKSIVPKCASNETQFKLYTLPGHHGTGSGNLRDQQRNPIPEGTTEHVQELVLVKILEFLKKNGVTITPSQQQDDPFGLLISPLFHNDSYSPDFENQAKALYYQLYNSIIENKNAYRHFNTTSYPTLGQEQALLRRIWKVVDQRIVHYQAHNDTFLESIVPPVPGGHFLNYEHARIHLNHELALKNGMSLSETINQSINRLISLCHHKKALSELKSNQTATPIDLNKSVLQDKLVATLDSQQGFELLLDGLGMLIEEVRRPYLQGQFTDPVEREALYNAVQRAFTEFKELAKDSDNEVAQRIYNTLNTNLESTLNIKRKALQNEYKSISIKLNDKQFFTVFQNKIQEILRNLNDKSQGNNNNEYQLDIKLRDTLEHAQSLKLSNPKPQQIRHFIEQELKSYKIFADSVLEDKTDLASNTLEWVNLVMNEALDDSFNYDVDNMMREVIEAHTSLEQFRIALPDFKALNDELVDDEWTLELEEQRDHLVQSTAHYIVNEGFDLQRDIKPLFAGNELLYDQIEGIAIGLGAANPLTSLLEKAAEEAEQLNLELKELKAQLTEVQEESEKNEASVIELQSQIRVLEQENHTLRRENGVLGSNFTSLSSENVQKDKELSQIRRKLSDLSLEHEEKSKQVEQLSSDISRLEHGNEELKRENKTEKSEISRLTDEKSQLGNDIQKMSVELDQLTRELKEKDKLVDELRSDIRRLESERTDNKSDIKGRDEAVSQLTSQNVERSQRIKLLEMQLAKLHGEELLIEDNIVSLTSEKSKVEQENLQLKGILNNDIELQCQLLVINKLIPLTKEYLLHLAKDIQKTVAPELKITNKNIPALIQNTLMINNWPQDESSKLLKQKFEVVAQLYNHLNDQQVKTPSEKVTGYYRKLNEANEVLEQHKDPKWQRYLSNAVAVVGIILTGVLPGLAALAIMSAVSGRSPKFWQSQGKVFVDRSKEEIQDNLVTPSPDKGV